MSLIAKADVPDVFFSDGLRHALGVKTPLDFQPEDVVKVVIDFANGDVTPGPATYLTADEDEWDGNGPAPKTEARARIDAQRQHARDMLSDAALGLDALAARLAGYADKRERSDVRLQPMLSFADKKRTRPVMSWAVSGPLTAAGWIQFAALVVANRADPTRELTDVGHCKYCGRFFLVIKSGRGKPARDYCPGTDHRLLAHAAGATERSRTKRTRDRAAARTRTARRHK